MSLTRTLVAAFAIAVMPLLGAQAGEYPDRPIELVSPFSPGGATDVTARLVATFMEKYLPNNARIVVINKTGGGGEVAIRSVLNAKPDGYTIGVFTVPNMLMKSHDRETFWTVDSLLPLANMVYDPAVVATRADADFSNAAELIAAAQKAPGEITVGILGKGSNDHLTYLDLQEAGGIALRDVSFGGSAAARTAVLGGHINLYVSTISDVLTAIRDGQFKAIGVVGKERLPMAAEVPTFAEQGINFKGRGSSSRGLIMRTGTPREIVDVLADAVDKALKDPELIAKATTLGLPIHHMGPDEYGRFLQGSNAWLAELWKADPWRE